MWIWEGGVPSRRKVQLLCRCASYGFFEPAYSKQAAEVMEAVLPEPVIAFTKKDRTQISKEETLLRKPMHNSERLPTYLMSR
jgi:hypothetical protein